MFGAGAHCQSGSSSVGFSSSSSGTCLVMITAFSKPSASSIPHAVTAIRSATGSQSCAAQTANTTRAAGEQAWAAARGVCAHLLRGGAVYARDAPVASQLRRLAAVFRQGSPTIL